MTDITDIFLGTLGQCQIELERLTEFVAEDHLGRHPDRLDYADLGDAKRLLSELRAITHRLQVQHDQKG